ncbi:hypothetical protein H6P81_015639 [Aristolochia fimbriata]|uniref:Uncharacterized protein n=1 Tax=Aristolochia fimbriata TaxID=158543 RepID=A0AAV7E6S1_ARIFI|nr:hypothetical protein H6P81_015639 [Aristolochia fimbriata]
MKKTLASPLILLLLFSVHHDGVDAQLDCYDACSTGCINPDDLAAAAGGGGNRG